MDDRNNFANMAQLEKACTDARQLLRRKHPSHGELVHTALQLNKAVRTLRSWLGNCNDAVRHARRAAADHLQALREIERQQARAATNDGQP